MTRSFEFERPRRRISLRQGIHYCLLAPLARLEGQIAFEMLLERFAQIDLLGGRPKRRIGIVLHGVRSLPTRPRPPQDPAERMAARIHDALLLPECTPSR